MKGERLVLYYDPGEIDMYETADRMIQICPTDALRVAMPNWREHPPRVVQVHFTRNTEGAFKLFHTARHGWAVGCGRRRGYPLSMFTMFLRTTLGLDAGDRFDAEIEVIEP